MTNAGRFTRLVAGVACLAVAYAPLAPVVWAAPAPNATTTLANSLRAIQDGENAAPRDHWDPRTSQHGSATIPRARSRGCAINTYGIPYHGILARGRGVLMDRQGDSLDRALLLAALFDEGHHGPARARHDPGRVRRKRLLPSRRFVDSRTSSG